MPLKDFKTLPGTIEIVSDINTFKNEKQAVWTGSSWRNKGAFTPTHGDTSYWANDSAYSISRQDTMYLPTQGTGLRLSSDSGSDHETNYELYGNGRWMPASCFNGLGFEIYQSSAGKHAVYLKKYALVFASKTNGNYRTWGVDTGTSEPSHVYRYIRVTSTSNTVQSIRSWGPSWLFQGIILHVANNDAIGSTESVLEAYNMKVGHKFSTVGGQYRYLPAGYRSYNDRNKASGLVPFTNPYTPK